jgi:hypothetical protein
MKRTLLYFLLQLTYLGITSVYATPVANIYQVQDDSGSTLRRATALLDSQKPSDRA